MSDKSIDCVVCGTLVADVLIRPVPLEEPVGADTDFLVEPLEVVPGGLVSNAATAMARLGARVAAFSLVGGDHWGRILRDCLAGEGIETEGLQVRPDLPTSTSAVLTDDQRRHTFAHHGGAARWLDRQLFFDHLEFFKRSRMVLIGYYSLLPHLEEDLPEVLAALKGAGCRTAMDAACGGGLLQPLQRILPHLDIYYPSHAEGVLQTGCDDPRRILQIYRDCGAPGILGLKLGERGSLLSPEPGRFVAIDPVPAPGEIADTVGAGDAFLGGFLVGLLNGLPPDRAGRLGAAAGACCVTGFGAASGLRDLAGTAELAAIEL